MPGTAQPSPPQSQAVSNFLSGSLTYTRKVFATLALLGEASRPLLHQPHEHFYSKSFSLSTAMNNSRASASLFLLLSVKPFASTPRLFNFHQIRDKPQRTDHFVTFSISCSVRRTKQFSICCVGNLQGELFFRNCPHDQRTPPQEIVPTGNKLQCSQTYVKVMAPLPSVSPKPPVQGSLCSST